MCRRNQLLGAAVLGFGIGLLFGCHFCTLFWGTCLGIGAAVVGLVLLQKK